MDILDLSIYKGRNIYSHKPVMKMVVDIGKYGKIPTKDIEGFNEKLLNAFPNLKTNFCGLGYQGGFLEKLNSGTYLAHVLEHVILDLQCTLGYDVKYGKTRTIEEPSVLYLVYEYENEVCGLECSKAAVFILDGFIGGEEIEIKEFLDYLKKVSLDAELGPSTSAIVCEAKERGIPVTRIGYESLIQLNYGRLSRLVESTLTDKTSCISADIASNKQLTKSILSTNKIPVPYGKVVYSQVSAVMAANQIGMPVVIKPFDGNQGKGVHLDLKNEADIKSAFVEASKYSNGIIVEQYIEGKDYRILVVGESVRAVSERLPAMVVGDGVHSIEELVNIANLDVRRGEHHEKPLTKIKIDSVVLNVLKKKGLDVSFIPKKDEEIILRENGNLSTGGTAIDKTDEIHPDNIEIAVRAANAIGIDIAGIDIVTKDISKSIYTEGGAVVEVNSAPGIRMHLYPSEGSQRNVARDIVELLYPAEQNHNFPIVSVTGTNGKTTTVRLIAHILSLTGKVVGYTSTSGTYVGDKCICKGDNSGPQSARALLSNKAIDAAVLETARGGIIREGLGYDLADIGLITNIAEDHLGVDNVHTLEDLAFVKSLVTEAIKENGHAVLNAENEMTAYLLERVKAKTILFSKNVDTFHQFKLANIYVFLRGGFIYIKDGENIEKLISISDIPITYIGKVECNIENCLAAVAALYGLGVEKDMICEGLKSFQFNMGRFHIHKRNGFHIMLDYAHNISGYEAVIKASKAFGHKRLVGVIGMPGDRPNEAIESVGRLCANAFDTIYLKEDKDLRGRQKGEVAGILENVIAQSNQAKKVFIADNEVNALQTAMTNAEEDDLIVVLYEKIEPLNEFLEQND